MSEPVTLRQNTLLVAILRGHEVYNGNTYFVCHKCRDVENPEDHNVIIPDGTRVRTNEVIPRELVYYKHRDGRAHALVCPVFGRVVKVAEESAGLELTIVELPSNSLRA